MFDVMPQSAMINTRSLLSRTAAKPATRPHDPFFAAIAIAKTSRPSHLKALGFATAGNLCLNCRDHHCRAVVNDESLSGIDANGSLVDGDDEDDELCPVDCVREFKSDEEFMRILDKAKGTGALVVVDFYRNSCGSCKYIEQGFNKLCKGSGDQETNVLFFKHNVIDEYDEQSEVADRLRIKVVPLFHFYKNGVLLEAFPTRDKERIISAIQKYASSE